jgi:hypothetical protein
MERRYVQSEFNLCSHFSYSLYSFFRYLVLEKREVLGKLWESYATSKVIVFTWQLLLPTMSNLLRRRLWGVV